MSRPRLWDAYVASMHVPLREHVERLVIDTEDRLDARIDALDRLLAAQSTAAALAISKAEQATTIRFESVNEFRAQMGDASARFATREYVDAKLDSIARSMGDQARASEKRLNSLEESRAQAEGRLWGVTLVVGAVVTIINIALRFVT